MSTKAQAVARVAEVLEIPVAEAEEIVEQITVQGCYWVHRPEEPTDCGVVMCACGTVGTARSGYLHSPLP